MKFLEYPKFELNFNEIMKQTQLSDVDLYEIHISHDSFNKCIKYYNKLINKMNKTNSYIELIHLHDESLTYKRIINGKLHKLLYDLNDYGIKF